MALQILPNNKGGLEARVFPYMVVEGTKKEFKFITQHRTKKDALKKIAKLKKKDKSKSN